MNQGINVAEVFLICEGMVTVIMLGGIVWFYFQGASYKTMRVKCVTFSLYGMGQLFLLYSEIRRAGDATVWYAMWPYRPMIFRTLFMVGTGILFLHLWRAVEVRGVKP